MGDLGDGSFTDSPLPVAVTGLVGAGAKVALGDDDSCALTTAGEVFCWGSNWWGGLGISSTDTGTFSMAQHVTALSGVPLFGSGIWHVCAVSDGSGDLACWGHNAAGEVGDGNDDECHRPRHGARSDRRRRG